MRIGMLAVALLVATSSCQRLATGPGSLDVLVRTEGTSFARQPDTNLAEVTYTVENQGNTTLLLARCGDRLLATLERWENGQWVHHSSDACPAINPMDALTLAPGASSSSIRGVGEQGRFRLRPRVGSGAGQPTDWTFVPSNEFTVE